MTIAPITPKQFLLALLGIVMVWPAALNGGPFLFPDTTAYIRAIDAALVKATGHHTSWSNDDVLRVAAPENSVGVVGGAVALRFDAKPVLLGRSAFYGALAFVGVLAGSLWISIMLQALIVGTVILGSVRHFVSPLDEHFARTVMLWMLALATTPLAWFTSMVMPDFLTGLSVVAAAALVTGWRRETLVGRIFWVVIAAYAALAHSSHVLILLFLAMVALTIGIVRIPAWRPGASALAGAALIGLLGESVFAAGVAHMTNSMPIRPPFLTARLVDDGPGTDYLSDRCPSVGFLLCRYRDRLPMASDTFLWGASGKNGVFMTLPVSGQRELAAEQGAFVRAVVIDRPFAVLGSSLGAVLRQFSAWGLSEFKYAPSDALSLADHVPIRERAEMIDSRAYRGTMPTALAAMFIVPWTLAGLAGIIWAWRQRWMREALFAAMLAAGWIVNTALCGALSTPHDRYQARVIWVMALAALTISSTALMRRAGSRADLIVQPEKG